VTGLYPEHHGIVANNFYDPSAKRSIPFRTQKPTRTEVGTAGRRSGCSRSSKECVQPACSGRAQSRNSRKAPSYYLHFDDKFPDEQRVQQILAWLRLPAKESRISSRFIIPMWTTRGTSLDPALLRLVKLSGT